jgi:hypothetical protein
MSISISKSEKKNCCFKKLSELVRILTCLEMECQLLSEVFTIKVKHPSRLKSNSDSNSMKCSYHDKEGEDIQNDTDKPTIRTHYHP